MSTPEEINARAVATQREDLAAGRLTEVRDASGRVIAVATTDTYWTTVERAARLARLRERAEAARAAYPYARGHRC